MGDIIFIAHVPLIRMKRRDDFPIGGGVLTRLDWSRFNSLTQHAFEDWEAKYERTDPVCFWFQQNIDVPFVAPGAASDMLEMKVPSSKYPKPDADMALMGLFHQQVVDPVWAALALAAPHGLAAPPRSSFSFVVPAGEQHLDISGRTCRGIRIQGDADLELAFLADGAGDPLDDVVLERASSLVPLAKAALADTEIGPALRQLLASGDVSLTAVDQMLLTVTATENLLAPDVETASAETLSRHVAHLLAHDEAHRAQVTAATRDLYRRRNAVVHASVEGVGEGASSADVAAQLLAGSVEGAMLAQANGLTLAALRKRIDAEGVPPPAVRWPQADAPGRASAQRLGPREPWFAGTISSQGSLDSPDGLIVSWSPLVGLQAEGAFEAHPALGVQVGTVGTGLIVSMEEKDIRRDFIRRVQVLDLPVATLAVSRPHDDGMVNEASVAPLTRVRDLAVAGLRLAGFDAFIDPALLGWYVYHGTIRHRRETVLRQSVLTAIQSAPPLQIVGEARKATIEAWSLLSRYEEEARHDDIDRMLDLYRRIHDRHFIDLTTRASLATIAIETTLGPFRAPTAKLRLESLVDAVQGVPAESAAWFRSEGRAFRNGVAHGRWQPAPIEQDRWWTVDHEPLAHYIAILRAALRELLQLWLDADPPVRAHQGPQGLLARTLGKRIG